MPTSKSDQKALDAKPPGKEPEQKKEEEQLLQKRKEKFLILQCRYMTLSTAFWEILTDDKIKQQMIKDLGDKFMKLAEEVLSLDL